MSDEKMLVEGGYQSVIRALHEDQTTLNVDVLAQACARKARDPSTAREDSLGWARAAIACYRKAAAGRAPGFDRQGSEAVLFGLKGLMMLRWGAEVGSSVLDPEDVLSWIQEELDHHASPRAFRDALESSGGGDEHERAVLLKERLQVGLPLFERGLLPSSLSPWFAAAGLLRDV